MLAWASFPTRDSSSKRRHPFLPSHRLAIPRISTSLSFGSRTSILTVKVATWNFSGLCSERKQKEVAEILSRLNIDIVAGQESWEREGKNIVVDGYKWFGKPRKDQSNSRGEGGIGFLVRECQVDEVEFVSTVKYEESMWMKVRGGRGREALYICCVYIPTDSSSVSVIEESYARRMFLGSNKRER